jgi:hypothetical protein
MCKISQLKSDIGTIPKLISIRGFQPAMAAGNQNYEARLKQ